MNIPAPPYHPFNTDNEDSSLDASVVPLNSLGPRPQRGSKSMTQTPISRKTAEMSQQIVSAELARDDSSTAKNLEVANGKPLSALASSPVEDSHSASSTDDTAPSFSADSQATAEASNQPAVLKGSEKYAYAEKKDERESAKKLIAIREEQGREKLDNFLRKSLIDLGINEEQVSAVLDSRQGLGKKSAASHQSLAFQQTQKVMNEVAPGQDKASASPATPSETRKQSSPFGGLLDSAKNEPSLALSRGGDTISEDIHSPVNRVSPPPLRQRDTVSWSSRSSPSEDRPRASHRRTPSEEKAHHRRKVERRRERVLRDLEGGSTGVFGPRPYP
jgi:hypothetical protein